MVSVFGYHGEFVPLLIILYFIVLIRIIVVVVINKLSSGCEFTP